MLWHNCSGNYQASDVRIKISRTVSAPITITIQELEERMRQQLYAIHEIIDETKTETVEHGAIVENWMHLVTSTVKPDRCIARRDSQEGWTAVGIMRLYNRYVCM